MGKAEDVRPLPGTTVDAQGTTHHAGGTTNGQWCLSWLKKVVSFRCVGALVLGVAVLLSAVLLLPFSHFGDGENLDLDYAGHDVVACFMLKKPASFIKDYILQLEDDIFDEISFSSTKVEIISLESSGRSNITKVVFAVEADLTTQSLIRASFVSLITKQSSLRLTASLFGDPFLFDVLKFRGGITTSPDQKAFLMQRVKIPFNFTLNFSIDEIIRNFDQLTSQLITGLRLGPYENLYIRLTNLKGSTVSPPTTLQSQVLLAVGINPSKSRLKQLAQTITGSHSKNLGLNDALFGRVKHVRLSSILQHSLGNDVKNSPSPSPSPSPTPNLSHRQHRNHDISFSPSFSPSPSSVSGGYVTFGKGSPTPAPTPVPALVHGKNKPAEPPCHFFGYVNRPDKYFPPYVPPVYAPSTAPSQSKKKGHLMPKMSAVSDLSPSDTVAFARSGAPSEGKYRARHPEVMPLISTSPSLSCAGIFSTNIWVLLLFTLLGMHL